jgi:uncharacterized protein YkwD
MTWLEWLESLLRPRPKPQSPKPVPKPTPQPVPPQPGHDSLMLDELNSVRAAHMLEPFLPDGKADLLAQGWANHMHLIGIMTHGDFSTRFRAAFPDRTGEENIAEGQPDAASVVRDWMNSPRHRANILNPDMTHFGSGQSGLYWCAVFLGP